MPEVQKGKKFSKTYQPKNRGRKPSHLKKWIKEDNVSTQDIRLLFSKIISGVKTMDDMKALLTDPKTPPIVLMPIKAMLDDFRKGKIDTIAWLTEYAYGKAQQEITNINTDTSGVDELSQEERREVLYNLLEKAGYIVPIQEQNEDEKN